MALELLADISWKATLVLALAWGGTHLLLRRGSATVRHAMWALALAITLVLPLVATVGPTWRVGLIPASWTEIGGAWPATHSSWQGAPTPLAPDSEAAIGMPVPAARRPVAPSSIPWSQLLVSMWGVGVLIGLLRLGLGLLWVHRLARSANHLTTAEWSAVRRHAASVIGITGGVPVALTPRVRVPVTCGLVQPTVLLPCAARRWSPDRWRVVLLHELAHVKRRDCLVQLLGQVAVALYWYNPLVWVAVSHLRHEQERACDDLVVSTGTSSAAYARHLCDVALAPGTRTHPQWATLAMASPSQLEQRIVAILDDARDRRRLTHAACLRLGGAATALAVIVGIVQVSSIDARAGTAASGTAPFQVTPDFSGTWLLDGARSESVTLSDADPRRQAEVGEVLVITQTATALEIETWRGGEAQTMTYRLDGVSTSRVLSERAVPTGQLQQGEAVVWSGWDNETLVTVAKPFLIWTPAVTGKSNDPVRPSVETIYLRRLADNGRAMTVERIGRSDFGWVFDGKEPSAAYARVRDVYTQATP